MKRPEGFDSPHRNQPARRLGPPKDSPGTANGPAAAKRNGQSRTVTDLYRAPSAREVRAELRRATKERRRYEREEVRRFTRRARSRRLISGAAIAVVAALLGVLALAVYSPILALRTISVEGAALLKATEVSAALSAQLGTPLALLDFGLINKQLSQFPLIRSYVTETIPPSTLVIHLVEREPVGAIAAGGLFQQVDPAGVVVAQSSTRPSAVPLIKLTDPTPESPGFQSVVTVLLALPADTLTHVDSITASTYDNVTFTLRGVGQSVVWGSADRSAFKSRVLIAMLKKLNPASKLQVDVSAPESVVVTKG